MLTQIRPGVNLFIVILVLMGLIIGSSISEGGDLVSEGVNVQIQGKIIKKQEITWKTVSKTYQVHNHPMIYSPPICNQIGTKYEYTIFQFDWKGEKKESILEVKKIEGKKLERSFICDDKLINMF